MNGAGEEFLSDAIITFNQDVDIPICPTLRFNDCRLHHLRTVDDILKSTDIDRHAFFDAL